LLGDATGRKLTRSALTRLIGRPAKDAGLPMRCAAHGLRKAILQRLAERAGAAQSAGHGEADGGTNGDTDS